MIIFLTNCHPETKLGWQVTSPLQKKSSTLDYFPNQLSPGDQTQVSHSSKNFVIRTNYK
jgi:hypothetical protein